MSAEVSTAKIRAAVELERRGLSLDDIRVTLGLSKAAAQRALNDERAAVIRRQLSGDSADLEAARRAYLLEEAWSVMEQGLSSKNAWVALNSARAIIADAAARQERKAVEVIISPALIMQDAPAQDAISADLTEDYADCDIIADDDAESEDLD